MQEVKFYYCENCGNMVQAIHHLSAPIMCCGKKMALLEPGTVEASHEKHIPAVQTQKNTVAVQIGEVEHPMIPEHSILWVYLQTDRGGQMKYLHPDDEPKAEFALHDEKPIAVYAYCNLHGLWKTEL